MPAEPSNRVEQPPAVFIPLALCFAPSRAVRPLIYFSSGETDISYMDMTFHELFQLIKAVVLSKEVIGMAVVIILILNMAFYVVSYKKRVVRKPKKRTGNASAASLESQKSSLTPSDSAASTGEEGEGYTV